jgi:hypothetical protein
MFLTNIDAGFQEIERLFAFPGNAFKRSLNPGYILQIELRITVKN